MALSEDRLLRARSRDMAPTITVIANELGLSRSTVSRAFTRPGVLRPETVSRVLAVAERIGYAPNHAARALSTGRNGNIALIVPDIANPFFPPLIRAAQAGADQQDYCVLLGDSAEQPERESRLISRFSRQVDGFILASSRLPSSELVDEAKRRPIVLVNRDVTGIPRVLIDSRVGVIDAVGHLHELGHRSIAYVGGPATSWSDRQRRRAVVTAAALRKMRVTTLRARPATYDGAADIVGSLLDSKVTAAIAFDDAVAHGILGGMASRGVHVPHDFSVIGCDDVLAATSYPPMTTIALRCADAGDVAVRLLLGLIDGNEDQNARHSLGSHLVVRSTTAPPRERRMAATAVDRAVR
jgi:LacI family transcriptional regulator